MFLFLESLILYSVKFNSLPRPMLCFSVIIRRQLTFLAFYKNVHELSQLALRDGWLIHPVGYLTHFE